MRWLVVLAALVFSGCSSPCSHGRPPPVYKTYNVPVANGHPVAVFCTAHTSEPRVTTCEDGRGYLTDDTLKAQFADLEWHAFYERGPGPWWPPLEFFVTQDSADYAVNMVTISTGSTITIQAPDGRSLTLDFGGDTLRTSGDLPLDDAGKRFAEFAHFHVNNCDDGVSP